MRKPKEPPQLLPRPSDMVRWLLIGIALGLLVVTILNLLTK